MRTTKSWIRDLALLTSLIGAFFAYNLGGRALWREMFPLTPEELGGDFDLERTLEIGALPLVLGSEAPRETLRAYVQLYLREEIKGEALVAWLFMLSEEIFSGVRPASCPRWFWRRAAFGTVSAISSAWTWRFRFCSVARFSVFCSVFERSRGRSGECGYGALSFSPRLLH